MKTAHEILHNKHPFFAVVKEYETEYVVVFEEALEAMREYAKQVAKQALKDASENATVCSSEFDGSYVNTYSILNTPIQLP